MPSKNDISRDKSKMKVLIVKSSSLGDIIQCFPVLDYLHHLFPKVQIDWVVESHLASIIQAHPLIHRAIAKKWSEIRKEKYDYLFDLQGNCKSGLITFIAKAKQKIGFDRSSVREWPNIFATNIRFSVSKNLNIRLQYLSLLEQFFQRKIEISHAVLLKSAKSEEIAPFCQKYVMVCPGSKWTNKQLKEETLQAFLQSLYEKYKMRFLFVWGSSVEREMCERIQTPFSVVLPMRLDTPTWQSLMSEMLLVIAVDSSALHLCGTTNTPSFSIFGPTNANIFKPIGNQHFAFQGQCPYNQTFLKQCPLLRTCSTGACIREIQMDALLKEFSNWWNISPRPEVGRAPSLSLEENPYVLPEDSRHKNDPQQLRIL